MYHDVLSQRVLAFLRNDTGRSYLTCASGVGGEMDTEGCLLASFYAYKNDTQTEALNTMKLARSINIWTEGDETGDFGTSAATWWP